MIYQIQMLMISGLWWQIAWGNHNCLVSATTHLLSLQKRHPDNQYRIQAQCVT